LVILAACDRVTTPSLQHARAVALGWRVIVSSPPLKQFIYRLGPGEGVRRLLRIVCRAGSGAIGRGFGRVYE
jgi:hypothetical protein